MITRAEAEKLGARGAHSPVAARLYSPVAARLYSPVAVAA